MLYRQEELLFTESRRQEVSISETPFKIIYTKPRQEIFVDETDYEWLNAFTWWITGNGYVYSEFKYKHLSMHRMIMSVTDSKIAVDHRDRNKLNNRRENLRVCTQAQNTYNKGLNKNNTSGFKGVNFDKKRRRFRARIGRGYGEFHLGYFDSAEEAAKARDVASLKIHGEYGRLNSEID